MQRATKCYILSPPSPTATGAFWFWTCDSSLSKSRPCPLNKGALFHLSHDSIWSCCFFRLLLLLPAVSYPSHLSSVSLHHGWLLCFVSTFRIRSWSIAARDWGHCVAVNNRRPLQIDEFQWNDLDNNQNTLQKSSFHLHILLGIMTAALGMNWSWLRRGRGCLVMSATITIRDGGGDGRPNRYWAAEFVNVCRLGGYLQPPLKHQHTRRRWKTHKWSIEEWRVALLSLLMPQRPQT